jgi:hypothetical protein
VQRFIFVVVPIVNVGVVRAVHLLVMMMMVVMVVVVVLHLLFIVIIIIALGRARASTASDLK